MSKDGPLNEALRTKNWDNSVKALAQFPRILDMLGDQLDWTQRLGDAFLAQRDDLMDAVQHTAAQQRVATPRPPVVPSREPFRGRVEQPRVEQRRAEQPRVEQPRAAQPRAEQGRPQLGRGGQEAVRSSVQPAPRPGSSRPQPGDSPRVQARPAPAPAQRREPGECDHENRESVAPPSPSVRNAHVAVVATGSVHEASSPSASSGGVQGGGAPR